MLQVQNVDDVTTAQLSGDTDTLLRHTSFGERVTSPPRCLCSALWLLRHCDSPRAVLSSNLGFGTCISGGDGGRGKIPSESVPFEFDRATAQLIGCGNCFPSGEGNVWLP
jgi:hypothetical protein